MENIFLCLLILVFILTNISIFSQESKHDVSIYLGYGLGSPDKRYEFLFDQFPSGIAQDVINSGRTSSDDEYSAGVIYKYRLSERVKIGAGMSYAKLIQDFMLPANGNTYFGKVIEPFFWRDTSQYHMAQFSPSMDLDVLQKNAILGFNITSINNISFRKHINSYNISRNKLEFFASELYSGIYAEYKRIRADIGFRVLHLKFRDDAIANNGFNPDTYNPLKMRFQLSYVLW